MMRNASQWTSELLDAARTSPRQLRELVEKIQADAKSDGYAEAMTLATVMASDILTSFNAPAAGGRAK